METDPSCLLAIAREASTLNSGTWLDSALITATKELAQSGEMSAVERPLTLPEAKRLGRNANLQIDEAVIAALLNHSKAEFGGVNAGN